MDYERVTPDRFIDDEAKEGEPVEVEISPGVWVPGTVIADMETRISVSLRNPVCYLDRIVTRTITKSLFGRTKIKEEVVTEYSYRESIGPGRWFVRRPL